MLLFAIVAIVIILVLGYKVLESSKWRMVHNCMGDASWDRSSSHTDNTERAPRRGKTTLDLIDEGLNGTYGQTNDNAALAAFKTNFKPFPMSSAFRTPPLLIESVPQDFLSMTRNHENVVYYPNLHVEFERTFMNY
jgi:hypothetical protein